MLLANSWFNFQPFLERSSKIENASFFSLLIRHLKRKTFKNFIYIFKKYPDHMFILIYTIFLDILLSTIKYLTLIQETFTD